MGANGLERALARRRLLRQVDVACDQTTSGRKRKKKEKPRTKKKKKKKKNKKKKKKAQRVGLVAAEVFVPIPFRAASLASFSCLAEEQLLKLKRGVRSCTSSTCLLLVQLLRPVAPHHPPDESSTLSVLGCRDRERRCYFAAEHIGHVKAGYVSIQTASKMLVAGPGLTCAPVRRHHGQQGYLEHCRCRHPTLVI